MCSAYIQNLVHSHVCIMRKLLARCNQSVPLYVQCVYETALLSHPLSQAISFELLALYSRPLKMLDTLEKEVAALREKLAKKETNLKKTASAGNLALHC